MESLIRQVLGDSGITFESLIHIPEEDSTIIIGAKSKAVNKTLPNVIGGYAGKSLIEIIRDDLDKAYKDYKEYKDYVESDYDEGLVDGIAHALGILRSSSREHELDEAQKRYESRKGQLTNSHS